MTQYPSPFVACNVLNAFIRYSIHPRHVACKRSSHELAAASSPPLIAPFPPPAALPCPKNSHYEACGNACPATCTNQDAPAACTQPCVETCACNEGYVLSGGQCVAVASCGCTHDGRYYRPGEEFWADETCQSRCRCNADLGMVVCKEASCKLGERCAVVKGVRQCVAKTRSVCVATGDPHYTTFDGRRYDFMGTCVYRLAGLCSEDPTLVPFTVTVENNNRGSRVVSYTKEVTLMVYNMTLSLSQVHPKKLKVGENKVSGSCEVIARHLGGLQGPRVVFRWAARSLHDIGFGCKVDGWCPVGLQTHCVTFGWVARSSRDIWLGCKFIA